MRGWVKRDKSVMVSKGGGSEGSLETRRVAGVVFE